MVYPFLPAKHKEFFQYWDPLSAAVYIDDGDNTAAFGLIQFCNFSCVFDPVMSLSRFSVISSILTEDSTENLISSSYLF